ncbi:transposase [Acerihabitans sp.]|uniref:transposase n=1 Tax=Acerihabitans sp. TaxID=2811394 RepID=UPI002EDADAAD
MVANRSFSPDFKREAASLVLDQRYSIRQACEAMDVGPTALRRWVNQLQSERGGAILAGSKAITPEQQYIQELEAKIRRIEREKEILKKATALLMSDSLNQSN